MVPLPCLLLRTWSSWKSIVSVMSRFAVDLAYHCDLFCCAQINAQHLLRYLAAAVLIKPYSL